MMQAKSDSENVVVTSDSAQRIYTDAEQRHIYETILSTTPDFVYVIGTDHRFTYANEALLQTWGRTAEDAIGKNFIELGYEPWHADMHSREVDQIIAMKKPIKGEVPFTGVRGTRIYEYIFSPIFASNGEVTAIAGTTRDVTERKNIEEELRVSEEHRKLVLKAESEAREHYSLMLDSAEDYAIISTDIHGIIISWNKGAERIFNYTREEAVDQPIHIIFTPEDRENGIADYELSVAAEKGSAQDERWHLKKDGSRFYASGIMTSMKLGDGQLRGFVKIARDKTYEKQLQEELITARNEAQAANIAKTEFLTNMSHEIRTPMNAVIGLSYILSTSQPFTPKQNNCIQTLQMSANSLLALLNDLLDISKIETSSVQLEQIPFSVPLLVKEVIEMMREQAQKKGLALQYTQQCACIDKRSFIGDPTRLRQILLNLCSNAIKFTEKGAVNINVICEKTDDQTKEIISIAVTDTGIGIAQDKLAVIFQKFVQGDSSINRKYGGTGLGLAITKTLAKVMGGTIEVESKVGIGSTFTVRLLLQIADTIDVAKFDGSLAHLSETSINVGVKPLILLVDDYAPNVLVASAFLEHFGYDYEVAENGIDAIEKIKSGNYAAVLMDVQMPGMNGLEATHLIRAYEKLQNKQRAPIIGMTAHALAGDRERCLGAGMDDYLAKPFNPMELQDKIQAIINAKI